MGANQGTLEQMTVDSDAETDNAYARAVGYMTALRRNHTVDAGTEAVRTYDWLRREGMLLRDYRDDRLAFNLILRGLTVGSHIVTSHARESDVEMGDTVTPINDAPNDTPPGVGVDDMGDDDEPSLDAPRTPWLFSTPIRDAPSLRNLTPAIKTRSLLDDEYPIDGKLVRVGEMTPLSSLTPINRYEVNIWGDLKGWLNIAEIRALALDRGATETTPFHKVVQPDDAQKIKKDVEGMTGNFDAMWARFHALKAGRSAA